MAELGVRALGPLDMRVDGLPVRLGGAKQRRVLACLVLRANTTVSGDGLAQALWGDDRPARSQAVLQVYVANLRRLVEPGRDRGAPSRRIFRQVGGYRMILTGHELDLLQFRDGAAAGRAAAANGDLAEAAGLLRRAVTLFRGPAFPDLMDADAFRAEVDEIEESHVRVYQELVELELQLGRHTELVAELQSAVRRHPYRERLRASLALALYRSDRQADALATCREARRLLAEELGVDPGRRLQELEALLLQQDPSLAPPRRLATAPTAPARPAAG